MHCFLIANIRLGNGSRMIVCVSVNVIVHFEGYSLVQW